METLVRDLKGFANDIRKDHLQDYVKASVRILTDMNLAFVKQSGLSKEQIVELLKANCEKFLISIENGEEPEKAKENFHIWTSDKPMDMHQHVDIEFSEFVQFYLAQKKTMLNFLPEYTDSVHEALTIISELETYYSGLENKGAQLERKTHKEAEISLEKSKEQFRHLIENIKDSAIFMVDTEGIIISYNQGAEDIEGYLTNEIIGKHISICYMDEEIERGDPQHHMEMARKNGRYEVESLRTRKDGFRYWANISYTALYDASEKLSGFLKVTRDISEQKMAEEKIKNYTDELRDSVQQMKTICDNAPDGIIITNQKGNIIKMNPMAERMFGWSEEEVIKKPLSSIIAPSADLEAYLKELNLFLSEGIGPVINKILEIEVLNKQGKELVISLSMSPTMEKGKRLFIGFIRDITESKKAQDELRNSQFFLNSIIENIPNTIFIKDAQDFKVVKINKAGEVLLGYSKDEIIGKKVYDFFPKEEAEFLVEKDKSVLNKGELLVIPDLIIHTKNLGARIMEIKKIPVYDSMGNSQHILSIYNDITERKKMEKALTKRAEELAAVTIELTRSNSELEQFAYVASHDLQEPLRMITSYVQLLSNRYRDKLDQDANDFIGFAVDGSNRMRNLINSLLEYSRINRVRNFENIEVNAVLENVFLNLSESIKESGAIIKLEPETLPTIYGDPVLISQLFQNLISNAIKFRGTRIPEITITGKKADNEFLFSVKDNGIGIKNEYSDKIFVIFQRLNTKDQYPGTGIGLAICKKIAERHGGKIWVESEVGVGSTFYFTIKGNGR